MFYVAEVAGASTKLGCEVVMKSGIFRVVKFRSRTDYRPALSQTLNRRQILRYAQNDKNEMFGGAHRLVLALIGSLLLAPSMLHSQVAYTSGTQAHLLVSTPRMLHGVLAKRLSDWLLEQPVAADDYPLGLSGGCRGRSRPKAAASRSS